MAYQNGFTYVSGPVRYAYSTVSSTATFKSRNPVTFDARGYLIEAASDTSAIWGIACNDAANSMPGLMTGKTLVEIPEVQTVYATKVQTGVAGSVLSQGLAFPIEKSGNYLRLDSDSAVSAMLVITGDQYGQTCRSEDSSVFVRFLGQALIASSDASRPIFAQL